MLRELNTDPQRHTLFYRRVIDCLLREMALLPINDYRNALPSWLQILRVDTCKDYLDRLNQE